MKINKYLFIFLIYFLNFSNLHSIEPDVFVQSTVNRASKVLSENISKDDKIEKLKKIAIETVDIDGIGLYTLGSARKSLDENEKQKYSKLFKKYFLKSLTSRLTDYSDQKFEVFDSDQKSVTYTIVKSKMSGSDQPEINIDWRIYTKDPNKPLIRDLIVEGLSLARTQKEEFASILNSNDNDINALFSQLENFISN